jgi:poly-beta-hydroxybutyrate-responsive repressor
MTPTLPRNFLRPCVLLLLREGPAHGYSLLERLTVFGFSAGDPGRLYRALRTLEAEGLVRSGWESSAQGPDRRVYELTRTGVEALHAQAQALADVRDSVDLFVSRYSEFVALGRPARGQDRTPVPDGG